jgi:divalent metal cation (Fe/Co/Zn/Cd) transporter
MEALTAAPDAPSCELPIITPAKAPAASAPRTPGFRIGERDRLVRQAKTLSWLSLAWMTVEGGVAITAAITAGSIALLGFGLDSVIEALASVIVIWRFTGRRRRSDEAEERARRLVAISFYLLAPYLAQDALGALIAGEHPSTSWVGIGLSISSLIVMPLLGRAKQRIGSQLDSAATAGEGTQNMLCAYLAAGVLAGLVLNAAFGVWWADPIIAVVIAGLAVKEGRETWRGDGCCAPAAILAGSACCEEDSCTG